MDLIARANSDLLSISLIADNSALSAQQRMARILALADGYRKATEPWKHTHRIVGDFYPIGRRCTCQPQSILSDGPSVDCPEHGIDSRQACRRACSEES